MNLLLPMEITGLLAAGMGAAFLGSVKVPLARKLEIDEDRVGGLVSTFGLAMIPVVLVMGFLGDLVGHQLVTISGAILMVASLVVLANAKKYWLALGGVLLLSAGWSGLINVLNVLMPAAFGGSEVFAMNLGNTFFGLGAFLTPLAIVFLLRRVGFTPALLVLAGFVFVSAVLALGVDFAALAAKQEATEMTDTAGPGMAALLQNPIMWLCAVALFFYLPLEATMAVWFTTYLGEKGLSEGVASGLLSVFWLAFMVSRLAVAFGLPAGFEQPLLVGMALAGTAVLAGVVWSRGRNAAIAMVVAAGLVFGPMFPTLIGVLLGNTDAALHGRAVGLFFALGGVGWMTVPMLIGAYSRRTSVQQGFLIAVGAGVGLCVMTFALFCTT